MSRRNEGDADNRRETRKTNEGPRRFFLLAPFDEPAKKARRPDPETSGSARV